MYKHLSVAILCPTFIGCSTPRFHSNSPRVDEKETILRQANKSYSDASVIGEGASLFSTPSSSSSFIESVKAIEGIEVDESTGILRMQHAILFGFDSYQVKKEAIPTLSQIVDAFSKVRDGSLLVCGYTDNIGSSNYNKILSLKRAEAVSSVLKDLGISSSQVSASGEGETNPIASNRTEQGRAKNRRVEFKLITP